MKKESMKSKFSPDDIVKCIVDCKLSLGLFKKNEFYKVLREDNFIGGWVIENISTKSTENILSSEEKFFDLIGPNKINVSGGIDFVKVSLEIDKECDHMYEWKELQLFTSTVKTLICEKCGEEKQ